MRHLKIGLITLLGIVGFNSANAQDENNPWAVGVGVNAIDFYSVNNADLKRYGVGGSWYDEAFNLTDHYNVAPTLSRLTVGRYLGKGLTAEVAGSYNQITHIGDLNIQSMEYFAVDGVVKYNIGSLFGFKKFEPQAILGVGYAWMDSSRHDAYGTTSFNSGLGFNYWFTDRLGFNAQALYKHSIDKNVGIMRSHFQYAMGIVYKFGGKNAKNNEKEVDSDGDGVVDTLDACPYMAGTINGCPDSDGDNIPDDKDNCPAVAGPAENDGCPWSDSDKDGILDKDDKCPTVAGVASNNGCPKEEEISSNNELPESVKVAIRSYAKTIVFDTGKATIKSTSSGILDNIVAILNDFKSENFTIEGHTDNIGSNSLNQKLSEKRAKAVLDYLISKGISPSRLNSVGYGEAKPLTSNNSAEGRSLNRRVEIKHFN